MKDKITLFENGKDIQEGDKFVAHVDSVEGHRRVTLERIKVAYQGGYISEDSTQDEDFQQELVEEEMIARKEAERDAYD